VLFKLAVHPTYLPIYLLESEPRYMMVVFYERESESESAMGPINKSEGVSSARSSCVGCCCIASSRACPLAMTSISRPQSQPRARLLLLALVVVTISLLIEGASAASKQPSKKPTTLHGTPYNVQQARTLARMQTTTTRQRFITGVADRMTTIWSV